jgi:hypothetical protein
VYAVTIGAGGLIKVERRCEERGTAFCSYDSGAPERRADRKKPGLRLCAK